MVQADIFFFSHHWSHDGSRECFMFLVHSFINLINGCSHDIKTPLQVQFKFYMNFILVSVIKNYIYRKFPVSVRPILHIRFYVVFLFCFFRFSLVKRSTQSLCKSLTACSRKHSRRNPLRLALRRNDTKLSYRQTVLYS